MIKKINPIPSAEVVQDLKASKEVAKNAKINTQLWGLDRFFPLLQKLS